MDKLVIAMYRPIQKTKTQRRAVESKTEALRDVGSNDHVDWMIVGQTSLRV